MGSRDCVLLAYALQQAGFVCTDYNLAQDCILPLQNTCNYPCATCKGINFCLSCVDTQKIANDNGSCVCKAEYVEDSASNDTCVYSQN
jgi:hypothetical protein